MTDVFDFHADDYGLSASSDKTILELCAAGKLDSISFLPNLSYFDNASAALMELNKILPKKLLVSVHLNFVEGHCCADTEAVPDLVDKDGLFTVSWEKLFFWSLNPIARRRIKKQLVAEITAQTERLLRSKIIDKNHVRFDSHMHTHMIPLVFDALIEAARQNDLGIDFIRDTHDPIHFYMGTPGLYATYSPVNAAKCMILNLFSVTKVRPSLRKMGLTCILLCGVFFSGKMDRTRLERILPVFRKKAQKKRLTAEILFHPCQMTAGEFGSEFNKPAINEFHASQNRITEYEAVRELAR